ncbi:site-specific DNA-methyltransferase [Patescibacteria group bacterium]|nr:site-specific DNA-methyltransferase [Patescibacteria group bacterium]
MQLNDNEKQDILRYLEAGKPLPEKYRFMLFEDKREVELVWNGKTNEVTNVVLPFQVIEQVDEPREDGELKMQQSLFDTSGRQISGWTNKLIWGDNKLILSSLKNGPLRKEIEAQGGLKLIYIDPPFDVGADFSMDIEIGDESFTKKPSVLEELAYRDTWGKGADSFIAMMHERLHLMRDLLADDGSIFVHCDWRVSSYLRLILDEVFGKLNFRSTIAWKKATKTTAFNEFGTEYDSIIIFCKNYETFIFNQQFRALADEQIAKNYKFIEMSDGEIIKLNKKQIDGMEPMPKGSRRFRTIPITNMNKNRPNLRYEFLGHIQTWAKSKGKLQDEYEQGLIFQTSPGTIPVKKQFLDENKGVKINDLWIDIAPVQGGAVENTNYPTQKPEALIERILLTSTNAGDLVADFFCGSGTTMAVAEKLGRKWLGSDLGKFAIHTSRKRMIGVQRELKNKGKDYRAFEILNLGKYERQHYIGVNLNLREEEREKQMAEKEKNFLTLILTAYKAEEIDGFRTFHGKKAGRMVTVGPINLPVTRLFTEAVIAECMEKHITKVDVLAFEFEMGLAPNVQDEAKVKGIDLTLKYIPRDVFDRRAIEKNQIVFHDVAYIEVKPHIKKNSVTIELVDFSAFYNQDSIKEVEESLKSGGNKLVVENGQIIKVSKDKNGIITRDLLTQKWTDWIDYWAVDFDYESKKEIIRVQNEDGKEEEEKWTGDYIFENEWQSFRIKKDRNLELVSAAKEVSKGRYKVAVKVVDIFGNDTTKVIEINV